MYATGIFRTVSSRSRGHFLMMITRWPARALIDSIALYGALKIHVSPMAGSYSRVRRALSVRSLLPIE